MPSRIQRVVTAIIIIVSVHLVRPLSIAAEDLARTLERPISAGSIALLAPHSQQPAARTRLIAALQHENASVRATAARVAFVTLTTELTADVTRALANETDRYAAVEQVRALGSLAGAPSDAAALSAVERFRHPTAVVMAEQLARNRPRHLARHLPALLAVGNNAEEADTLAAIVAAACVQHPTVAGEILTGVMDLKRGDFWMHVLNALHETTRPIASGILQKALASEDAAVRTDTVFALTRVQREGAPIADDVLKLAAPKSISTETAAAGLTWEDFARELLARLRGAAPVPADWVGVLTAAAARNNALHLQNDAFVALTEPELKALEGLPTYSDARARRDNLRNTAREALYKPQARTTMLRTLPVFAQGLLSDLMSVTGCHAGAVPYVGASFKYRVDGGPERVTLMFDTLSNGCQAFLRALMALNVALPTYPALLETDDHVFVYLDRRAITCADHPFPSSEPPAKDAKFEYPKAQRRPSVAWPGSMKTAPITKEQFVVLGLRLNHTGCVSSAVTIRSLHPAFDLAAITAMFPAQWSPAKADGKPTDTYVTFSVTYSPR